MEKIFVGDRFREFLHLAGISKADLARTLGCSTGYLSDVQNDKKQPGVELLGALFRVYRVNINYMVANYGPVFISETSTEIAPPLLTVSTPQHNTEHEERIKELETELAYARGQAQAYKAMAEQAMSLSKTGGTPVKGMAKGFR